MKLHYGPVNQQEPGDVAITKRSQRLCLKTVFVVLGLLALAYLWYWLIKNGHHHSNTATPPDVSFFQLRLKGNLSEVANQTELAEELQQTIATELGTPLNQVVILALTSGSIVVDVEVFGFPPSEFPLVNVTLDNITLLEPDTNVTLPVYPAAIDMVAWFLLRTLNTSDPLHNDTVFVKYPILQPEPPVPYVWPLNLTNLQADLHNNYPSWPALWQLQLVNKSYVDTGQQNVFGYVNATHRDMLEQLELWVERLLEVDANTTVLDAKIIKAEQSLIDYITNKQFTNTSQLQALFEVLDLEVARNTSALQLLVASTDTTARQWVLDKLYINTTQLEQLHQFVIDSDFANHTELNQVYAFIVAKQFANTTQLENLQQFVIDGDFASHTELYAYVTAQQFANTTQLAEAMQQLRAVIVNGDFANHTELNQVYFYITASQFTNQSQLATAVANLYTFIANNQYSNVTQLANAVQQVEQWVLQQQYANTTSTAQLSVELTALETNLPTSYVPRSEITANYPTFNYITSLNYVDHTFLDFVLGMHPTIDYLQANYPTFVWIEDNLRNATLVLVQELYVNRSTGQVISKDFGLSYEVYSTNYSHRWSASHNLDIMVLSSSGKLSVADTVTIENGLQLHYDAVQGIQIKDLNNNAVWLTQVNRVAGSVSTLHNVLDNANGDITAQGTVSASQFTSGTGTNTFNGPVTVANTNDIKFVSSLSGSNLNSLRWQSGTKSLWSFTPYQQTSDTYTATQDYLNIAYGGTVGNILILRGDGQVSTKHNTLDGNANGDMTLASTATLNYGSFFSGVGADSVQADGNMNFIFKTTLSTATWSVYTKSGIAALSVANNGGLVTMSSLNVAGTSTWNGAATFNQPISVYNPTTGHPAVLSLKSNVDTYAGGLNGPRIEFNTYYTGNTGTYPQAAIQSIDENLFDQGSGSGGLSFRIRNGGVETEALKLSSNLAAYLPGSLTVETTTAGTANFYGNTGWLGGPLLYSYNSAIIAGGPNGGLKINNGNNFTIGSDGGNAYYTAVELGSDGLDVYSKMYIGSHSDFTVIRSDVLNARVFHAGADGKVTTNSGTILDQGDGTGYARFSGIVDVSGGKAGIKWDSGNGVQIYDGQNAVPWIYQGGTNLGVVRTRNSFLDDGFGGQTLKSSLSNTPNTIHLVSDGTANAGVHGSVLSWETNNIFSWQISCQNAKAGTYDDADSWYIYRNGNYPFTIYGDNSVHTLHNILDDGLWGHAIFAQSVFVSLQIVVGATNTNTGSKFVWMGYDPANGGFIQSLYQGSAVTPLTLNAGGILKSANNILDGNGNGDMTLAAGATLNYGAHLTGVGTNGIQTDGNFNFFFKTSLGAAQTWGVYTNRGVAGFYVDGNGKTTVRAAVDDTAIFSVYNAAATNNYLVVDTVKSQVTLSSPGFGVYSSFLVNAGNSFGALWGSFNVNSYTDKINLAYNFWPQNGTSASLQIHNTAHGTTNVQGGYDGTLRFQTGGVNTLPTDRVVIDAVGATTFYQSVTAASLTLTADQPSIINLAKGTLGTGIGWQSSTATIALSQGSGYFVGDSILGDICIRPDVISSASKNVLIGSVSGSTLKVDTQNNVVTVNGLVSVLGGLKIVQSLTNAATRPSLSTTTVNSYEIAGFDQFNALDDGFLRFRAGGGTSTSCQSFIDISGCSTVPDMDQNIVFGTSATERMRLDINGVRIPFNSASSSFLIGNPTDAYGYSAINIAMPGGSTVWPVVVSAYSGGSGGANGPTNSANKFSAFSVTAGAQVLTRSNILDAGDGSGASTWKGSMYLNSALDTTGAGYSYAPLILTTSESQSYRPSTPRWEIGMFNQETQSGNTGSDFAIWSLDDTAGSVFTPLTIRRSDGNLFLWGPTTVNNALYVTGNFQQTGTGTFSTGTGAVALNGPITLSAGLAITQSLGNFATRPAISATTTVHDYEVAVLWTGGSAADDGFLRIRAGGGSNPTVQSFIDISGYSTVPEMNQNIVLGTSGTERMRLDSNGVTIADKVILPNTGKYSMKDASGNVADIISLDTGGTLYIAAPATAGVVTGDVFLSSNSGRSLFLQNNGASTTVGGPTSINNHLYVTSTVDTTNAGLFDSGPSFIHLRTNSAQTYKPSTDRWTIGMYNHETQTANTGSDFAIWAWDDNGAYINYGLIIQRSDQTTSISGATTINNALTVTGNFIQTGAGSFSTGTSAVSLNGDVTVATGKTLTTPTITTGSISLTGVLTHGGTVTALDYYEEFTTTLSLSSDSGSTYDCSLTMDFVRIGKMATTVLRGIFCTMQSSNILSAYSVIPTRFIPAHASITAFAGGSLNSVSQTTPFSIKLTLDGGIEIGSSPGGDNFSSGAVVSMAGTSISYITS